LPHIGSLYDAAGGSPMKAQYLPLPCTGCNPMAGRKTCRSPP
jgi:hypothetical protein